MGRPRSWTDEDLVAAVATSSTVVEVLERLGLAKGGGSLTAVRRRMLELGLDAPELLRNAQSEKWAADPADDVAHAPVRGRWSEDELRMAVVASTSMRQVMEHLGYGGSGGAWTAAKAQILELGLDTSHFGRRREAVRPQPPRVHPRRSWTDDSLRRAVATSTSVAGVLRQLGLKPGGSMYVLIQQRIRDLGLDTTHWKGQGWRKGTSRPVQPARALEEVLVRDSTLQSTAHLRQRLVKEGVLEPVCSMCGGIEWNGRPMPLQLDHINGDRTDNRRENLRLLCPNCHAQTDTWCGKNRGRYDRLAPVLELVYRPRSNRGAFGHEGSTPSGRTRPALQLTFGDLDSLD